MAGTSTMMMERTGMAMPGMMGSMGTAPMTGSGAPMAGMNWVMVPRCTVKVEKTDKGMRMTCTCQDAMARTMMQNLCTAMQGGMCSYCVMMNGMMICSCNLTMGMCTCEMTNDGIKMTCTSGDAKCCQMIQACCDSLNAMLQAGCTCCLMMNNTPVCCGCS
jgi:hypothetical protein